MRDFSIDIIWAKLQMAIAAVGGWLGYFLGGMDGLLTALLIFMAVDNVTGLMCAVADKKLSSSVGFKGTAENGWHAIVVNAQIGWVSGKYSKTIE